MSSHYNYIEPNTNRSLPFNVTNNDSLANEDPIEGKDAMQRFVGISTALLVLSLITNAFSIAAIRHIPGPTSCSHMLYLNLAITETLCAIVTYLEAIPRILYTSALPPFAVIFHIQDVQFIIFALLYCASGITLLELAILRFVAIRQPLLYNTLFSTKRIPIMIASIWICAALLTFPGFCIFGEFRKQCGFWNYVWPCGLIAIIITIIILYAIVSQLLMAMSNSANCRHQDENRKAIVTTVILVCSLMIGAVPYIIFKLVRLHHYNTMILKIQDNLICFLPYLNFICDPFIYGIRTRDIRKGYRHLNEVCRGEGMKNGQNNGYTSARNNTNQVDKATEMITLCNKE